MWFAPWAATSFWVAAPWAACAPRCSSRIDRPKRAPYPSFAHRQETADLHAWPIPSFVINLERNAERRAHMASALERLGIPAEFTPAVDGRALTPDQLARYDRPRA